jgi:hypothetical protein
MMQLDTSAVSVAETQSEQIDVFISYAREDHLVAKRLARAFESRGWRVWFDLRIEAGATWDRHIEKALDAARCVVVLWSKASVASDWVRAEALAARSRNIVVPAQLDDTRVPLVFRVVQTPNLAGWVDDTSHPGFVALINGVAATLGVPEAQAALKPKQSALRWVVGTIIALPTIASLALHLLRVPITTLAFEGDVSEFHATLAKEREVTDLLSISELAVAGIAQIDLPRFVTEAGTTRAAQSLKISKVLMKVDHHTDMGSGLTLDSLLLPKDATVEYQYVSQGARLRIFSRRSTHPVRVNLSGAVLIELPGEGSVKFRFGTPKAAILLPGGVGTDLDVALLNPPSNLLPVALPVSELALARIDQRTNTGGSLQQEVSTVRTGRMTLGKAAIFSLDANKVVRFKGLTGEIQSIGVNGNGLEIRFAGTVSGLAVCMADRCKNLMPTLLETVWFDHRFTLYAAVFLYIAASFFAVKYRLKTH